MRAIAVALLVAGSAWAHEPADAGVPDAGPPTTLLGCAKEPEDANPSQVLSLLRDDAKQAPEPFYVDAAEETVDHDADESAHYLNGIGAEGRCWEFTSDTAFGNRRILTQRVEIARAFKLKNRAVSFVLRIGLGADALLGTGIYAIQGLVPSLGVRYQPPSVGFSFELGVRVIPAWDSPDDREPEVQTLALGATLTSGIGNDAAWLPFSNAAGQFYVDVQSRTGVWFLPRNSLTVLFGARYGLGISLGTVQVHTWLGPQSALIGNVYVEGFLGIPTIMRVATRLQLGLHVDASLSSIWPGNLAFPGVLNFFMGWSPLTMLSFRAFVGHGGSPGSAVPSQLQYGVKLQFYVP